MERERYGYLPLVEIQGTSRVPPGEGLFGSLLVFENYPIASSLQTSNAAQSGLRFELGESGAHENTHYGLSLLVSPGAELGLRLSYSSPMYGEATIAALLDDVDFILDGLVQSTGRVRDVPYLQDWQVKQLTLDWNATQMAYPPQQCLHGLFEAQARSTPDAVALVYEEQQLSYAELNARANRIAHGLVAQGVGPEVRVGLCVQRSLSMVIGMLGILKAGGCYVPLDPSYPPARLEYLLSDSGVSLVVTESALRKDLGTVSTLCLDEPASRASYSTQNLHTRMSPQNLAYVIYTSGSTGRPKGVGIAHGGVISLLQWSQAQVSAAERAGVLACTSMCFDLSIYEIFLPLCHGGTCVLVQNALSLEHALGRERVTLVNTVPSAAKALLQRGALPRSVAVLNLAGEPLKAALVDDLYEHTPIERIYDLYGPSEGTTYSTYTLRERLGIETIGRAVANTQAYVLDEWGQLQAVGVVGELYLGGVGLARGYLDRAGLTAEKFVPNPFGAAGDRLYRTGDRVRWLAEGTLEYVGRIDHQVKVRGFRIELGEIESVLTRHAGVKDVIVVAREDAADHKQLVAYVVVDITGPEHETITTTLRAHMQAQLPAHMVPAAIVVLDALPLTPNGKVDRKALPAPDRGGDAHSYVPPQGATEELLATLWSTVLGIERVGRDDNFFELGGHSLMVMQLVSQISAAFSVELPVWVLFEQQTLAAQARAIESSHEQKRPDMRRQRIVAFDASDHARRVFCIPGAGGKPTQFRHLAGSLRDEISVYALRSAAALTGAHDGTFKSIAEDYVAILTAAYEPPYYLVAHSIGALIAYEMAQRVGSEQVQGLLFIDPISPRRIVNTERDHTYYSALVANNLEAATGVSPNIEWSAVSGQPEGEIAEYIAAAFSRENFTVTADEVAAMTAETRMLSELKFSPSGVLHTPDVHIVIADGGASPRRRSRTSVPRRYSDWTDYFVTAPDFVRVAGTHFSLLTRGSVDAIADLLRSNVPLSQAGAIRAPDDPGR